MEVEKQPPHANGNVPHQRLLDPAEPADQLRSQPARNAVGEEKIDVLLLENAKELGANRHGQTDGQSVMGLSTPARKPRFDHGHNDLRTVGRSMTQNLAVRALTASGAAV